MCHIESVSLITKSVFLVCLSKPWAPVAVFAALCSTSGVTEADTDPNNATSVISGMRFDGVVSLTNYARYCCQCAWFQSK